MHDINFKKTSFEMSYLVAEYFITFSGLLYFIRVHKYCKFEFFLTISRCFHFVLFKYKKIFYSDKKRGKVHRF